VISEAFILNSPLFFIYCTIFTVFNNSKNKSSSSSSNNNNNNDDDDDDDDDDKSCSIMMFHYFLFPSNIAKANESRRTELAVREYSMVTRVNNFIQET
jgi:hypothetical protein